MKRLFIVLSFWSSLAPLSLTLRKSAMEKGFCARCMRSGIEASWYDAVTFTQKSTTYNPDGTTKVETLV